MTIKQILKSRDFWLYMLYNIIGCLVLCLPVLTVTDRLSYFIGTAFGSIAGAFYDRARTLLMKKGV